MVFKIGFMPKKYYEVVNNTRLNYKINMLDIKDGCVSNLIK